MATAGTRGGASGSGPDVAQRPATLPVTDHMEQVLQEPAMDTLQRPSPESQASMQQTSSGIPSTDQSSRSLTPEDDNGGSATSSMSNGPDGSEGHMTPVTSTPLSQRATTGTGSGDGYQTHKVEHPVMSSEASTIEGSQEVGELTPNTMTANLRTRFPSNIDLYERVEVPILGYELMEERARFTVFKIQVRRKVEGDLWFIFRRYSDFDRLNSKLRLIFPHFRFSLPPKKWFGDNYDKNFLEDRIIGLQAFLNNIVGHRDVCNSEPVREFFCFDEPPGPHDSLEESRALCELLEEQIFQLHQHLQERDTKIALLQEELQLCHSECDNLRRSLRIERSLNRARRHSTPRSELSLPLVEKDHEAVPASDDASTSSKSSAIVTPDDASTSASFSGSLSQEDTIKLQRISRSLVSHIANTNGGDGLTAISRQVKEQLAGHDLPKLLITQPSVVSDPNDSAESGSRSKNSNSAEPSTDEQKLPKSAVGIIDNNVKNKPVTNKSSCDNHRVHSADVHPAVAGQGEDKSIVTVAGREAPHLDKVDKNANSPVNSQGTVKQACAS